MLEVNQVLNVVPSGNAVDLALPPDNIHMPKNLPMPHFLYQVSYSHLGLAALFVSKANAQLSFFPPNTNVVNGNAGKSVNCDSTSVFFGNKPPSLRRVGYIFEEIWQETQNQASACSPARQRPTGSDAAGPPDPHGQ